MSTRIARAPAPPGRSSSAEPETQFYGDRIAACRDLEGHHWSVSQTIEAVTREEALERVGGGMKITGWV